MDTLDKHFRQLTQRVFERHGLGHGELVARWPEIVGAALADHCTPDRIRFPRKAGEVAQKSGGTLHVTAVPGRSLDVQYEAPRMIERINRFFGYGAIAAVKITQGSVAPRPAAKPGPPAAAPERLTTGLGQVEDPELRQALARLAAGVASRRPSSPQGQ